MIIIASYSVKYYVIYVESLFLYEQYKNNSKNYCNLSDKKIINNLLKDLPYDQLQNISFFNMKKEIRVFYDIDNYSIKYLNNLSLFKVGVQYNINNRYNNPNSIIRIARFESSFGGSLNNNYHLSDIYMNIFSRTIKNRIKNRRIKKKINFILTLQNKLSNDIIRYIFNFLDKNQWNTF